MMTRAPLQIEQAFRRVRWQDFVLDFKRSWFEWAAVVTLVFGFAYYSMMPVHVAEVVHGTAIGAHQPPSEDNSAPLTIAVRLETDATVNVPLPRGTLYRAGSQVEVAIIRGDWPPHPVRYRFVRYAE